MIRLLKFVNKSKQYNVKSKENNILMFMFSFVRLKYTDKQSSITNV